MSDDVILVDEPRPRVRRITMNRPEKRNSLIHPLRGAILETLRAHDQDAGVSVTIIRGGPSFSAGYDLGGGTRPGDAVLHAGRRRRVARHVTEGVDEHLGPRQAGHRPGARLLPRGSERARDRLRPRLHRPKAQMGYPAVRLVCPTCTSTVVPRHAQGDGDDADRRLHLRHRSGRSSAGRRSVPGGRARRPRARGGGTHRWCRSSRCSSTSASCIARWTRWVAPASAPVPSSALGTHTARCATSSGSARSLTTALEARRAVRRLPHRRLTARPLTARSDAA